MVMAACDTAAVPSGSGGVVPEAGVEPAHELLLRQRPLPLGYSGSSGGAPSRIRTCTALGLNELPPTGWAIGASWQLRSDSASPAFAEASAGSLRGLRWLAGRSALARRLEPQPGIETGSAAYKAAASPQCFRGKKLRTKLQIDKRTALPLRIPKKG